MDKYALAKLVQWSGSGGVVGRKRLQKVVYFLQQAGCTLGAEYSLHHYGPYSRDVAEACDELVASGLLDERAEMNSVGTQYTYRLSAGAGESALSQTERRLAERTADLGTFRSLAEELLSRDLWELELGSTILYFYDKTTDWDKAAQLACEFKRRNVANETALPSARALAMTVQSRSTEGATG